MRCFIAIDIDADTREEIRKAVSYLKGYDADIKWVRVDVIHLTLKFLGEVREELIPEINKQLQMIGENHPPFSLTVSGTGVFPDYTKPRVLWIGVNDNDQLQNLFSSVDRAMESLGFAPESRKFRPHLTIGRVKSKKGINTLVKELRRYRSHKFGKIDVNELNLMKSTLKPTGAVYDKVFTAPLKGRKHE